MTLPLKDPMHVPQFKHQKGQGISVVLDFQEPIEVQPVTSRLLKVDDKIIEIAV